MMIMIQYQEFERKRTNRIGRFIALIMALLMAFTLSACGKHEAVGIGPVVPAAEVQSTSAAESVNPASAASENLDQTSGKESPAEDLVEKFFEALRAGDFETTIGCFTPSFQNEYKAALAISSQILRVGSSDLSAIIRAFIGGSTREDYRDYKFDITGTEKLDDTHANVTFDVYVGEDFDRSSRIACIKYGDEWYLDDAPMTELADEASKPQYNFTLNKPFKNGSFTGQYCLLDGYTTTEYDVLVNENYQIIFQKKTDDINWSPFGDDGYSYYLDKAAKRCAIIDSNGIEQSGFDDTEDTHYSIVGHDGQGVFLLLRHVENVFENGYYICAIDAQGDMLAPETKTDVFTDFNPNMNYLGEGIFTVELSNSKMGIYNLNTNNSYVVSQTAYFTPDTPLPTTQYMNLGLEHLQFVNGCAYYKFDIGDGQLYSVSAEAFASYDTFTVWVKSLFENSEYVYRNFGAGRPSYLKFIVPTEATPMYAFPDTVEVLYSEKTAGDYYIVILEGADQCNYVTLTDVNGVMLFNPIYLGGQYGNGYFNYKSFIQNHFYNSCLAMFDEERQGVYILNPDGTEKAFLPLPEGNYEVIGFDDSNVYVNISNGYSKIIDIETGEVHSTIR